MTTPVDYPFETFLKDLDCLHTTERLAIPSFEAGAIRVVEYMRSEYGDTAEARLKATRFTLVMMYLSEHVSDFDIGDYGVEGSEESGSLVSEHVLRAVHQLFTGTNLPKRDPSPEQVLHLARQFRDSDYSKRPE